MATSNFLSHYASLRDKEEFITNGDYCIDTEEQLDDLINTYKPTEESHEENEEASANNIEAVLKACEPKTPKYIFRGVNEASYRLYTTAQRAYDELKLDIPYSDFIQFYIDETLNNQEICNYFEGKDYQITDFLILSLLQHYGYPTPLLDFSYDIYSALFFAIDNMKEGNNDEEISDYVSLYIVNSANEDMFPKLFHVNQNDGETIQQILLVEGTPNPKFSQKTKRSFSTIPFQNYKDSLILLVSGGADSATRISIPNEISVDFYNNNPNLESQHGLFMYNSSYEKSLDRVIYKQSSYLYKDKIVCFNINKNLKKTIVTKYLEPRNINKETIYSDSDESKNIAKWLKKCNFPSMTDIYRCAKFRENIIKASKEHVNTDNNFDENSL